MEIQGFQSSSGGDPMGNKCHESSWASIDSMGIQGIQVSKGLKYPIESQRAFVEPMGDPSAQTMNVLGQSKGVCRSDGQSKGVCRSDGQSKWFNDLIGIC
jgi:hypothetical protein